MPIKVDQLPATLERGLAPVYLVAGDEFLLVSEAVDAIRARAQQEGFSEREILTVERGFDWNRLYHASESQSLFTERKIIDLRIPTGKPGREGSDAIVQFLENPNPDNLLIVSCHQFDAGARKSKWVKSIDKAGVYVQIWPIKPYELPAWIKRRMQDRGLQPDSDAVQLLAQRLEGNLLAADQEINKLSLLKSGQSINRDDVQQWVADSARYDVYLLVDCLLAGDQDRALRIAAGLQAIAVPVQMLIGALVRELSTLQQLHERQNQGINLTKAFQQLGVWKVRQPPMQAALARLSQRGLDQATALLANMDKLSKGRADGNVWLELNRLIGVICGNSVRGAA